MGVVLIPIALGLLIGALPAAGRAFAFCTAVSIFAFLVLTLIVKWGAPFSGLDLIVTVAYPFVVIFCAGLGYLLRVLCEVLCEVFTA
jgi:hypothetical protein